MSSTTMALAAPVVGALLVHLLMPAARKLGTVWGLVDHPSWRRNQTSAIPCSGGLAIYVALVLCGIGLGLAGAIPFELRALGALALAGLGTLILGVVDDRFGLHAEKKLLGQIVVVSLPMASGLVLERVALPGVGVVELGLLSGPVTLFWYLGFINSVNLIDGLDGLASGIVALVLGALWLVVAPVDTVGALWVLATLGVVLGFLRNNLSQRRIFLGDAGSMLLGLWLAGLVLGLQPKVGAAPWMAALAMAIPILDTSSTILRRWRRGVSVFRADDEHLHHRLLRIGMTPRRAVAVLLLLTVACAAGAALVLGRTEAALLALGGLAAAAVEVAYTLPRDGSPRVSEALAYLFGVAELDRAPVVEAPADPELAPIIEMQPYQRRRATAEPEAEAAPAKKQSEDDVVLALGDEPR